MVKLYSYKRPWRPKLNPALFFLIFCSGGLFGQSIKRQTIAPATSNKSTNGVNVSQTIGQPYQTKTTKSENFSYRPGFQQPIFSTELLNATVKVIVVPNPALLSFYIECSDTLLNAELKSYDEAGKLIFSEELPSFKKHEVQCVNWANGAYIITVTDKKNNLVTTKLIKTQ